VQDARRNVAEYRSNYSSYTAALEACWQWLQTAAERLEAACLSDTESNSRVVMDKISSVKVLTADLPALYS